LRIDLRTDVAFFFREWDADLERPPVFLWDGMAEAGESKSQDRSETKRWKSTWMGKGQVGRSKGLSNQGAVGAGRSGETAYTV